MVAISDKFGKASISTGYATATTVKTARTAGVTVLETFDMSDFAPDTPVFFVTYKKTTDPVTNKVTIVSQTSWKALVNPDNNTLTNLVLAPGYTDIGNEVGDFVECIPTSFWGNSLIEGLFVSLNPDGTLKTSAVNTALGITGVTPPDWNALPVIPTVVSIDGQKQVKLRYTGVDYRPSINEGFKLRIPRTGTTPTQSMAFVAASSQYATKATPVGLAQTDDITVETKVYIDSYTGAFQYLINARQSAFAGYFLAVTSTGQVAFYAGNGTVEDYITTYNNIPLNRWVHVAAHIDMSAGTGKIYLDGIDVGSFYTNSAATSFTSPTVVRLGANFVGTETVNGKLANTRIWSEIRTAAQIRDNMDMEVPTGSLTNLKGHWKGNGSWSDSSTNANHLTPINGAVNNFASHPYSAIEHAIATKVEYTGGNTDVTVFTGSGCIPNETLGATSYSTARAPYGFPADRSKWQVLWLRANRYVNSGITNANVFLVTAGNVYLPAGAWKLSGYGAYTVTDGTAGGYLDLNVTFSTSGVSVPSLHLPIPMIAAAGYQTTTTEVSFANNLPNSEVTLSTFGQLYMWASTTRGTYNARAFYHDKTYLTAECAYL